ncbi:unnamed protein product [Anisakis simplex]|uniref:Ovule protein n=1 Tax=Anisakis simplex TaxID=6269 RepID=A0A0M3J9N3_ANISI|nr:unnamed protein product [Anisakis simplex]
MVSSSLVKATFLVHNHLGLDFMDELNLWDLNQFCGNVRRSPSVHQVTNQQQPLIKQSYPKDCNNSLGRCTKTRATLHRHPNRGRQQLNLNHVCQCSSTEDTCAHQWI